MAANRSNKLGQQQTGKHGGRRQPAVTRDGTRVRRALSVGVEVVVGAEGGRTVEPSLADVTRVVASHVHMHVAEFPIVVVLEEIRPTLKINTTN